MSEMSDPRLCASNACRKSDGFNSFGQWEFYFRAAFCRNGDQAISLEFVARDWGMHCMCDRRARP